MYISFKLLSYENYILCLTDLTSKYIQNYYIFNVQSDCAFIRFSSGKNEPFSCIALIGSKLHQRYENYRTFCDNSDSNSAHVE